MSEVFSNERLIDYFTVFDIEINKIDQESLASITSNIENSSLTISYKHRCILQLPKVKYKVSLKINVISPSLLKKCTYLSRKGDIFAYVLLQVMNKEIKLVDGTFYYGSFLRIYEEYPKNQSLLEELPDCK